MKVLRIRAYVILLAAMGSSCLHTGTSSTRQQKAYAAIHVDPEVLAAHQLGWTARSNYVGMTVPYAPIAAVKKAVEAREDVLLNSRGEAHITIITPPEMMVLRTRMSLEQINGFVAKLSIQSIPIQVQCLGRSQLQQGDQRLASYYLVVEAPGLLHLREKLRQQFMAAGGEKQAFAAELYYPHITVGFTERDLHESDGVIKDSRSCLYKAE
jgi:2'-5' RNA ligase